MFYCPAVTQPEKSEHLWCVFFLFPESLFLFLSLHFYLLHLFLPLSFVYSGEGGARYQSEEDGIMMSSHFHQQNLMEREKSTTSADLVYSAPYMEVL